MLTAVRTWLKTVPARLTGSYVDVGREYAMRLRTGAKVTDAEQYRALVKKRRAARQWMLEHGVKQEAKRIIEEQPDVPVAPPPIPVDFEDLPA